MENMETYLSLAKWNNAKPEI